MVWGRDRAGDGATSISVWSEPVAARPYSELSGLLITPRTVTRPPRMMGVIVIDRGVRAVVISQPSRRDMARAQLTIACTWPETSAARHSTDHG